VGDIQRARILSAMVEVVAEQGLAGAAVATVLGRAGISRRTFYEFFESREDCFLAALNDAIDRVATHVLTGYREQVSWQLRIRKALTCALSYFDEHPDTGRLLVVEALAAGPKALERRNVVLSQLVRAVDEGRRGSSSAEDLSLLTAEAVVGAVLSVVHSRMLEPRRGALVELVSPLMGTIVLPYMGRAAARRELERVTVSQPPLDASADGVDQLRELDMRLTHRTICVLKALAARRASSNREVSRAAGITDAGQISKLLRRLAGLGLVENVAASYARGASNAWALTERGALLEQALRKESEGALA
jgi:AcrR family transcriptional regulator